MKMNQTAIARRLAAGLLTAVCMCVTLLRAQTLEFLHVFEDYDGALPGCPLVQGTNGSFYGITRRGGNADTGTLFQMASDGTLTTLVSFDGWNGSWPRGPLVAGGDGNFYGTTGSGGDLSLNGGSGYGTIFQITPDGAFTTLVQFTDSAHNGPGNLLLGRDGNFYGTTGGDWSLSPPVYGTLFEMTPGGVLTTLAHFNSGTGSLGPFVQGSDGSFYGTAGASGGSGIYGLGRVFKMSPEGLVTTIVSFNATNGDDPLGRLVQAADGRFYGTTSGLQSTNGPVCGTVFKVTTNGALTTLVTFNGTNGCNPWAGLIWARDGNFYGTTASGGDFGFGTVFQMTPNGRLTTLASFNPTNGPFSSASLFFSLEALVQGSDGNLYGTSNFGGDLSLFGGRGAGTIYRVVLPPARPTLSIGPPGGNQMVLSWPTNANGFILQSSSDLNSSANWTTSTATPAVVAGQYVVTNAISGAAMFYRLKK